MQPYSEKGKTAFEDVVCLYLVLKKAQRQMEAAPVGGEPTTVGYVLDTFLMGMESVLIHWTEEKGIRFSTQALEKAVADSGLSIEVLNRKANQFLSVLAAPVREYGGVN